MHELVALAVNAVILLGLLHGSVQDHPIVFAAGTGHEGLACTACHHPHAPLGVRPEWQPATEELPHFPYYNYEIGALDGGSRLCLSCHDGAVATAIPMPEHTQIISQVGRSVGVVGRPEFIMGGHPVGVRYDPREPTLVRQPGSRAGIEIALPEGRVQCVSCHDPHGTSGHEHLLVVSNRRSGLCLTCHQL